MIDDDLYDFVIGQGDTAPALSGTAQNADKSAIDLTGLTSATFVMESEVSGGIQVSAAAAVTAAATGKMKYVWASGDTDLAGDYLGYFDLVFSSGTKERVPNDPEEFIRIRVGRKFS